MAKGAAPGIGNPTFPDLPIRAHHIWGGHGAVSTSLARMMRL